jgi:hypothetical protein
MRIWDFSRGAFGICAAAAMLADCSGSQPPIGAPGAMPVNSAIATHAAHSKPWMLPEAASADLLYISSNDRGNVYAYTYPQGELVGTLTGFISPVGECADAAGDVFIVAYSSPSMNSSTIYEYAHGGTSPIATLSDPQGAFSCAVDPTSGDLAATGRGVAIYKHASGKPRLLFPTVALWYCGYDDKGNLYVSAVDDRYADQARLLRLAPGGRRLEPISLNAKLYTGTQWPSVQWDGKHLAVSSMLYRKPITIYRLRISGDSATVIGTTTVSTPKNYYYGQTWIQSRNIIGVGMYKRGYQSAFFWPFPKGGEPRGGIEKVGNLQQILWGVTVSVQSSGAFARENLR